MVDYLLVSKPRITIDVFRSVLKSAQSPAYTEATACWKAIVAAGIDPALALAQFDKESTYGKFGAAHLNHSWGNLRGYPGGQFKHYPTWAAGAADYARLLASSLYAGSAHYNTARTMPYRYAPSADHNSPAAYGQFLVNMIQHYRTLNATPSPAPVYYTVVSGDTLSGIAIKFHTTVAHLLYLNPTIKDPNLIHPGDKVRVR